MRKTIKALVLVLCLVLCMSVLFACNDSEEPTPDPTPAAHEHDYTELKSDGDNHWYACPADDEIKPDSKVAHVDENRDGKCDVCQHAVDVIDRIGVSFEISGNDGGTVTALNGVSVTIGYKKNSFTATIADGKFTTNEIVPFGTYTVKADGYFDATVQIAAGAVDAVVLNVKKVVEDSIAIETIEGVPTLVVEGMIPEVEDVTIGNVMLHFDATYNDTKYNYYFNNVSKYAGVYRFEMAITEIPVHKDTPWCWFHIYPYAEENPTKDSTPLTTDGDLCNLQRGDVAVGTSVTYNEVAYTVQDQNQFVLQAKALPKAVVESIELDFTQEKAELVVKGTTQPSVKGIVIHATANNDANFYGSNGTIADGKFECRFDFAEVVTAQLGDTPWCWFHIFTYNEENPGADKLADPDGRFDLERGTAFTAGSFVDYNGVRYEVIDKTQLVIQPKATPAMATTSIEFDTTGDVPTLVVKGDMPTDTPCVKLHIWSSGGERWWENVATDLGKYEFRAPISDLPAESSVYYFHTWTYEVANAADDATHKQENVQRGELITAGSYVEYNGVRYRVNTADGLEIYPQTIDAQFDVQSISVDTTNGLTLVVKGSTNTQIPCLKIHADGDSTHYYGAAASVVTDGGGVFELRFDLTQLEVKTNTPWYWFHIYVYSDVEPADDASYAQKVDLQNGKFFFKDDQSWTYNQVRYEVHNADGQLVFQSKSAE